MNKEELAARREHYLELVAGGMNFTAAARCVGVSKRTGKVWRNGRARTTGRNEPPSIDRYRGDIPTPVPLHPRYLSEEEHIHIADLLHTRLCITYYRTPVRAILINNQP